MATRRKKSTSADAPKPKFASMTNEEVNRALRDPGIDSVPEPEREELQLEACKRNRWKWTRPDGSVAYEPPDWEG